MTAKHSLVKGNDLDDTLMNGAQTLERQYANINGFQNTVLGQGLHKTKVDSNRKVLQLLHTGEEMFIEGGGMQP